MADGQPGEDREVLARQVARLAELTAAAGALLYAAEPARGGRSPAARYRWGAAITLVLLVGLAQRLGLQAALAQRERLRRVLPVWGAASSLASVLLGVAVAIWRGPVDAVTVAGALWLALAARAAWLERRCVRRVAAARAGRGPGSRRAQRRLVAAALRECHRRTGYAPAIMLPEVTAAARQIAAALATYDRGEPVERTAARLIVEHGDRSLAEDARRQCRQRRSRVVLIGGVVGLTLIAVLGLTVLLTWCLTWLLTLFARALRG